MIIFTPTFIKLLNKCGRRNTLMLGCLCEGVAMCIFGVLDKVENKFVFGIGCMVCRMIEGFGNGCINSSTSSIIAYNYEEEMGFLMGL